MPFRSPTIPAGVENCDVMGSVSRFVTELLDALGTSSLSTLVRPLEFSAALFASELTLKVVTFGFCCGKDAYVKSPWNLLDLAIVIVSFLVLLADAFPVLRPLKTLRILRVLRPLRLVARSPGMRLIVTSLIKAGP